MRIFVAPLLFAMAAQAAGPAFPPCVRVSAFARYGAPGYDHIVTIANGCDRVAACWVSTNVSPESIGVRVDPGTERSVLTFRGSPSSRFTARVRCELEHE